MNTLNFNLLLTQCYNVASNDLDIEHKYYGLLNFCPFFSSEKSSSTEERVNIPLKSMVTWLTCLDWIIGRSEIADTVASRHADVVDLTTAQAWQGAACVRGLTGHGQALSGHSHCCEVGGTFCDIPGEQSGGRTVLHYQMLRSTRTCNGMITA